MRRIVLGLNEKAESAVVADGYPPTAFFLSSIAVGPSAGSPPMPTSADAVDHELQNNTSVIAELWNTNGHRLGYGQVDPTPTELWTLQPTVGDTMWRHVVWGPHFEAPLHQTDTLDYDLILSGEVALVLENGEATLRAGDAIVIPGVLHGWRTGAEGCTLSCMMIGLPRSEVEGATLTT